MLKAENRSENLGKFLSWILRHGAVNEGIPIATDGFIPVESLLEHRFVKGRFTKNDIIKAAEKDEKRRFNLKFNETSFEIRANQGHSMKVVETLELIPITNANSFKCVVHGTFLKNWNKIKFEGLHRMQRNHIHFSQKKTDNSTNISGLRKNSEVYIYINLEAALHSGLKFFLSTNYVILCPGNEEGFIKPVFFKRVCRANGSSLEFH